MKGAFEDDVFNAGISRRQRAQEVVKFLPFVLGWLLLGLRKDVVNNVLVAFRLFLEESWLCKPPFTESFLPYQILGNARNLSGFSVDLPALNPIVPLFPANGSLGGLA